MKITMLKSKLHHAQVTHVEPDYEGSCAIDAKLMELAGIREFEQIHIYNLDNGERLITYAIRSPEGCGVISINGAAAKKASVGQRVIICTYANLSEAEASCHTPILVHLDNVNNVTSVNASSVRVA